MAYGTPELQSATIGYSLRIDHISGLFMGLVQASPVEDENTGVIDQAASDQAFQQLLDDLGNLTDFTVSRAQKQYSSQQSVDLTPPAE